MLQLFLGFVNFYRRFISGFARTALPLTKLLTKDAVFDRKSDCQNAFDQLRDCLLREPALKFHDPIYEQELLALIYALKK